MTTSADIVNRALSLAGVKLSIGDLQDGTEQSIIALQHYTLTVWTLLRLQDHEFSRKVAPLLQSGQIPPPGWDFEYRLPSDWLKVRSIVPTNFSLNNPRPVRWNVGVSVIGGIETNVIWTNVDSAQLAYTTNLVTEDNWDAGFTETVVQYLSSSLAPLLAPKDDKGQQAMSKDGPVGYAQAARIGALDVDRDS